MIDLYIEMSKDWNHKYDSLLIAYAMQLNFPNYYRNIMLCELITFV